VRFSRFFAPIITDNYMLDFVGAIIYNFNLRKYKKFFKGVALYESATDEGCGLLLTF